MTRPEFTRDAVISGGLLVAAGSISSAALAAALTTILGAELGDEGFGTYAFAIATAGLLGILARAGLGPIVVRDIARSVDDEAPLGKRDPIVTALAITATLTLTLAALTVSPPGLGILESAGDMTVAMVIGLAVMFSAQALYTINAESLRGLHHLGLAAFVGLPVQRLVSLVLVGWVVYLAAEDLDPELAIWLTAAASAAALLTSGVSIWIKARRLPGRSPGVSSAVLMARDGSPLLWANFLGLVSARLPVWVLAVLGDLDEAGTFALATAFVALIRLGNKTMNSTLSPFVATEFHSGSREDLQRRVRVAAAGTASLAIASALGLVVLGGFAVPRLFGGDFESAVTVATILLLGTVSVAVIGPSGLLLNVTGHERWTARASSMAVGVAVVLIFPASAAGGAIGAAAVMAVSAILNAGLQLRYAKKHTGVTTVADFAGLARTARGYRASRRERKGR